MPEKGKTNRDDLTQFLNVHIKKKKFHTKLNFILGLSYILNFIKQIKYKEKTI